MLAGILRSKPGAWKEVYWIACLSTYAQEAQPDAPRLEIRMGVAEALAFAERLERAHGRYYAHGPYRGYPTSDPRRLLRFVFRQTGGKMLGSGWQILQGQVPAQPPVQWSPEARGRVRVRNMEARVRAHTPLFYDELRAAEYAKHSPDYWAGARPGAEPAPSREKGARE